MTDGVHPSRVIGIDAGGSSTRACALINGMRSEAGVGGPGNALIPDVAILKESFEAALRDLPSAATIVACVAGAGSAAAKERVVGVLRELRPGTNAVVLPDYAAAFHALPEETDIAVIAGTGSVVCSPSAAHSGWLVSGGRGWILGDHGSATALGRALLEGYVNNFHEWPAWVSHELTAIYGDADWRLIVQTIHSTDTPAKLLAAAAPIVTRLAGVGDDYAQSILDHQLGRLAQTTVAHAQRLDREDSLVGLAGGVWKSDEAVDSFRTGLKNLSDRIRLGATAQVDPLDGALRLALQLDN
jgi:N-acetylglucosamine kinase-like BadF-type ATPase